MLGEDVPLLPRRRVDGVSLSPRWVPFSMRPYSDPSMREPSAFISSWRRVTLLLLLLLALSIGIIQWSGESAKPGSHASSHNGQSSHSSDSTSTSVTSTGGGGGGLSTLIRRRGDKLYEDGSEKQFRFVSFCVPNLHIVEDDGWHRIDPWEQEDAFKTLSRLGVTVARIYPLSVSGWWNTWGTELSHLQGPGQYNEVLFRDYDSMLALANKYNVRLILPILDNYFDFFGGLRDFAAFYYDDDTSSEKDKSSGGSSTTNTPTITEVTFFTNPSVREGFKSLVRWLVNRNNTITGVLYKDDPAILAYETINEIGYKMKATDGDEDGITRPTAAQVDAWTVEMAAYLKQQDPNHLVIDGRYLGNRNVSSVILADPNVDIVSNHFYPQINPHYSMLRRLEKLSGQTAGLKPFLIGEVGLIMPEHLNAVLQAVVDKDNVAGTLVWSLRTHSKDGGFYQHPEPPGRYRAYHFPGSDASEAAFGEMGTFEAVRKYNSLLNGVDPPSKTTPEAAVLMAEASTRSHISWRGAVGAQTYALQRRKEDEDEDAAWVVVAEGLTDEAYQPINDDTEAARDCQQSYLYRMIASNAQGEGPPSTPVAISCSKATPTVR